MSRHSVNEEEMSCHLKAFFFTKRNDTFFYNGKADTVFRRRAVVKYEFRDLPALFIEDMLLQKYLEN